MVEKKEEEEEEKEKDDILMLSDIYLLLFLKVRKKISWDFIKDISPLDCLRFNELACLTFK